MDNEKERSSSSRHNGSHSALFNKSTGTSNNIMISTKSHYNKNKKTKDDDNNNDDDDEIELNSDSFILEDCQANKYNDDLEFELSKSQNEISIEEDEGDLNESDASNTNKYLSLLGEDLLMEEKDILFAKAISSNDSKLKSKLNKTPKQNTTKKINNSLNKRSAEKHDNLRNNHSNENNNDSYASQFTRVLRTSITPTKNDHSSNQIEGQQQQQQQQIQQQHQQIDTNKETNEFRNIFLDKLESFSKSELISLIESLHRENIGERDENEKLKSKYNTLCIENRKLLSFLEQYHFERDEIVKEYNKLKTAKVKEAKKAKVEIEAISREYSQIMSERDSVHKEMEALQEQLSKSQDRLKKYARESICFPSGANVEVNSTNYGTLTTMSNTVTENLTDLSNELSHRQHNKINSGIYGFNMTGIGSMDEALEIDSLKHQLNIITKQRDEAIIQVFIYQKIFKPTDFILTSFNFQIKNKVNFR